MPATRKIHRPVERSSEHPRPSRRRARSRGPIGHICRLISFLDALYYVGDFLYRRSMRYSMATAAVCLLGYLGNYLPGVETYPARVAIALPLAVGSATLVSGLLLKNLPSLFFKRLANVAQAADLDLMEDYRKSQQDEHLEQLWQRVYRYEWAIGSALVEIHPHPQECPPEIASEAGLPDDPQARARMQFLRRAQFALDRCQSQPRQRYHLGIDLRFLEDWRNGGYFDGSDVKLVEQWEASATLAAVKREVGCGHWDNLCSLPGRVAHKFWTSMILRAIGVQVGEALSLLNRKYQTDYFNAQALLWPGEEDAPWLNQFPSARADLLERRQVLLERVFGKDLYDARRMLERMVLPCYLAATDLRARFDPEYLDGSLGYTAVSDLEALGAEPWQIEPYRKRAQRAQDAERLLDDFLPMLRPELAKPDHAESLRAVRIALHLDRRKLRRLFDQLLARPQSREILARRIGAVLDQVVRVRVRTSRLLVGLRVHHELTRLHHLGYVELLEVLYVQHGSRAEKDHVGAAEPLRSNRSPLSPK